MKIQKYLKAITVIVAMVAVVPAVAQNAILSLQDCKTLALAQNKKVKMAEAQLNAAKTAHQGAQLSSRPSFDASVMGIHVGKPLAQLLPPIIGSTTVAVNQPIYTGGKIKLGKEIAAKTVELFEGQKAMEETALLLAVENAYWQIVQLKEKTILARTYQQMLQALCDQLQNAVDAGLTYKNDLLRAKVNLNEAGLNIVKANDGLLMAKLSLAQLIGQPNDPSFVISDSMIGNFNELDQSSLDHTADKRPEIAILKKAIATQQLQTQLIKAELKPQIGLSLNGLGTVGKKVNFSTGKDYMFSYYGMLNVSVPIFDWGKNSKKVKEQQFKVEEKQLQLAEFKEQINLEVQAAWLQLNQSVKRINFSAISLQQAEENLKLANDRFTAGTITGKDVLEAQTIWQQAYTGSIEAKVAYQINMANYKKAIGELK